MDTPATNTPPRLTPPSWLTRWSGLGFLAGGAALGVLWSFEPAGQFFYPRCWLHETTGLLCPGCGTTRALHALLHGQWVAALKLNALAVSGLGVGAWLGVRWLWGTRTGRWWRNPFTHPYVIAAEGGLAVGFGVARNLTW